MAGETNERAAARAPMARTYNQSCVVAYALDLLGERWTILIVRELYLGPLRFAELLSNLEGIGPNLLTKRLRDLEEAKLVERVVEPGTKSARYQLTEQGERLGPTLRALLKWSFDYLHRTDAKELLGHFSGASGSDIKADSVVIGLGAYARVRDLGSADFICRLVVDDRPYTIFFVDGRLVLRRGAEAPAAAEAATDRSTLRRILTGETALDEALASGALTLSGSQDVIAALKAGMLRPAHS